MDEQFPLISIQNKNCITSIDKWQLASEAVFTGVCLSFLCPPGWK